MASFEQLAKNEIRDLDLGPINSDRCDDKNELKYICRCYKAGLFSEVQGCRHNDSHTENDE
jgi:hypothetical protein